MQWFPVNEICYFFFYNDSEYEREYRKKFEICTKSTDWKIYKNPHTLQKDAFNCGIYCLLVRINKSPPPPPHPTHTHTPLHCNKVAS